VRAPTDHDDIADWPDRHRRMMTVTFQIDIADFHMNCLQANTVALVNLK